MNRSTCPDPGSVRQFHSSRRRTLFSILRHSPRRLSLILLSCLPLLANCTLGPDFQPPDPNLPGQWSQPAPGTNEVAPATEDDLGQWWTLFNDPRLTSLIERAMLANLDLKIAENRIRQARTAMIIAGASLGPAIDASTSYRRGQAPQPGSNNPGITTDLYRIGFDAAWEIDLFGGTRRGVEAAAADLQVRVESRHDLQVSLSAEVAINYLNLRSLQQRLDIARRHLTAQEQIADLTRRRWQTGFDNRLDMLRAQAQAATTASQIPLLESQTRQTIHALGLLLGMEPTALITELTPDSTLPMALASVPAGLPSDLIRRRPDIRRAEAAVHAATARIGVATADLFPRFTITGGLGLQNSTLESTFNQASRAWSLMPSVNWPLLDMGRRRANLELKKALQEEELLAYQRIVLMALNEVENALITAGKEDEHRQSLVTAVAANQTALDLAITLYRAGENDFLYVLDAQRSLYSSEEALAQSNRAVSTNLVALFKALGGGWLAREDATGVTNPES